MKLRTKIILLTAGVVAGLGVLVAVSIKDVVISSFRSELEKRAESISLNLSDRIANLVLLGDYFMTQNAINEVLSKEKDIIYIFVTDESGNMFAHSFTGGIPQDILSWNPLNGKARAVQLLDTEKGYIRDIGVRVFDGMAPELHIGISEKRLTATLHKIRNIIIFLTIFVTIISTVTVFYMSRFFIIKPMSKLVEFAQSLARGDLGKRIQVESMDEIGELSCAFDKLSVELRDSREKREEAFRHMHQTEKLSSLGQLSGGLAHELKNPITTLKMLFQNYKLKRVSSITDEDMEIILDEIENIDDILTKFLGFAKQERPALAETNMNDIIRRVLSLSSFNIQNQDIKVYNDLPESLSSVNADRSLMEQVFLNLIMNSVEAMPDGGELRISGGLMNGFLEVKIADTGGGIPDNIKSMLFDPFFTTKDKGTGLGLSIAYNIVRAHKGDIGFESINQKGTVFTVRIPTGGGNE
ncbi:MAG TPA: HAMP domain-containing protein [Nitrospirae bacterium]|nr:HAMP domain-containing protein [Nitrospirota bacterium]